MVRVGPRRRLMIATAGLAALVVLLALGSLGIGPVRLAPLPVIDALFGGGTDAQRIIVGEIRLPRMILGLAIGAILGLSGAALQGLLRNPLASPSLFGAPQSAAFGAVLMIALGWADVRSYALPVAGIVMAFASAAEQRVDHGQRCQPYRAQPRAIISTAPNAADCGAPNKEGDASGLRSRPCSAAPDNPRMAPIANPRIMRGR